MFSLIQRKVKVIFGGIHSYGIFPPRWSFFKGMNKIESYEILWNTHAIQVLEEI